MQDIVEKSELVMVGSSPVKTATSVSALGPIDKVRSCFSALSCRHSPVTFASQRVYRSSRASQVSSQSDRTRRVPKST